MPAITVEILSKLQGIVEFNAPIEGIIVILVIVIDRS